MKSTFQTKKLLKKAVPYYGILSIIALAVSSFTLFGFLMLILFILTTCGFLTVEYLW